MTYDDLNYGFDYDEMICSEDILSYFYGISNWAPWPKV